MQVTRRQDTYTLEKEGAAIGWAVLAGGQFTRLEIAPAWRGKGYGSFLLKEVLRQNGAFLKGAATTFTAPLQTPGSAGAAVFAKHGFAVLGGILCRHRQPDYTAVQLCHDFLAANLRPGGFYVDATCGNGHDTAFLCRLAGPGGRVLALDIQPAAVAATNARLAAAGYADIGNAVLADHALLHTLAAPGSADCVVFNFGWLPGAAHSVHSTAAGSLPALQAALGLLKPGGVLAAVLYSGKEIGSAEKQAALAFFRALPLAEYTVLVCEFANWAATAPLPCFVIKRAV